MNFLQNILKYTGSKDRHAGPADIITEKEHSEHVSPVLL